MPVLEYVYRVISIWGAICFFHSPSLTSFCNDRSGPDNKIVPRKTKWKQTTVFRVELLLVLVGLLARGKEILGKGTNLGLSNFCGLWNPFGCKHSLLQSFWLPRGS